MKGCITKLNCTREMAMKVVFSKGKMIKRMNLNILVKRVNVYTNYSSFHLEENH